MDYARRQIKCPECRAEHRIPYQGVQTFPTNVTLTRFLELHRSITGEEPEPVPSMMERCGICSEKSPVERCAHCDKKICPECKEAHVDIVKREIARINAQVRRALSRLNESVVSTEKNAEKLLQNKVHIKGEVEEIVRRFVKDIKEKEEKLIHDLEEYASSEVKALYKLKDDLGIESNNIAANCDLIEKHVLEQQEPWTDAELVEYKDIFIKTLDFLRNFDPDTSDYTRKIKFTANADLDLLRKNVVNFGELKLPQPETENPGLLSPLSQNASTLNVPQSANSLMRSQSDHRLAAQFARGERGRGYLDLSASQSRLAGSDSEREQRSERATSPFSRRAAQKEETSKYSRFADRQEDRFTSRTSRANDYTRDWPRPDDDSTGFRSRFLRTANDDDEETGSSAGHRSVRFEEPPPPVPKAFDTLEAPRGPLSGVVKLVDTTHLMTRLHENEIKMKQMEEEKKANELAAQNAPAPVAAPPVTQYQSTRRSSATVAPVARQVSEDEIEKQKKENKAAAAAEKATETAKPVPTAVAKESAVTTTAPASRLSSASSTESSRYVPRRVTTLREDPDDVTPIRRTSSTDRPEMTSQDRPPSGREAALVRRESRDDSRDEDDDDSVMARYRRRKEMTSVPPPAAPVTTSTSTTASRQVSGLTSDPPAPSTVSTDTPASSVTNGSSRFLREVREDSDSDSDNPSLPPLSQYARTRNTETAYSPMNTASFSMRRGSTTELPTPTTTPPTTPSATSVTARSAFSSRTPSIDQELDSRTGVREPAAITSAPKIVPLSLRRRESSPLLLRQATMPVTASDKSFVKRDYTSLRSRSPSADREASKSTTNLESYRSTQYTPPTTPTRRTNYDSGRDYSSSRYSSSGRSGLSSFPYTSSSFTSSSTSSSAPRTSGLARSSTVGDMLSRSSRYTGLDRDTSSSYSSGSSARDPFARRASPSSLTSTSSSISSSRPAVSSSSSSYRRPSMSSSLTLTDATSNEQLVYRSVTRASSLFFSSSSTTCKQICTADGLHWIGPERTDKWAILQSGPLCQNSSFSNHPLSP